METKKKQVSKQFEAPSYMIGTSSRNNHLKTEIQIEEPVLEYRAQFNKYQNNFVIQPQSATNKPTQ